MATAAPELSLVEQAFKDMPATSEADAVEQHSLLPSIPRELRDMIYEMAFQGCVAKVNKQG